MPKANTKSYEVDYEPAGRADSGFNLDDLPKLIRQIQAIGYNLDLNTHLVSGPVNEVQQVTVLDGNPFTLTAAGQPTASIPAGATDAQVRTALEALSNIGDGDVVVTRESGGPPYVYTLAFQGGLAAQNLPQIAGSANVTVQTLVQGSLAVHALSAKISKNGVNPIDTPIIGRVFVWDKGWLYDFSPADFLQKYTPIA